MTNKEKFCELLSNTKRNGIETTLDTIEKLGFFDAPASTRYHGSYNGGLVEHSLNVYQQMMYLRKVELKINPQLESKLSEESCIVVSLLHDVCKSNFYKSVKKWRKNSDNKWEEYDTYEQDYSYLPIGHGEKSLVILIKSGLELTEDEMLAIRWHMGSFDISDYPDASKSFNIACDVSKLAALLVASDWLASRITEVRPTDTIIQK